MTFSIILLACDIRTIVRLFEHILAFHFLVLVHKPTPSVVLARSFLFRCVDILLLTPLLLLRLINLTVLWVFHEIRNNEMKEKSFCIQHDIILVVVDQALIILLITIKTCIYMFYIDTWLPEAFVINYFKTYKWAWNYNENRKIILNNMSH